MPQTVLVKVKYNSKDISKDIAPLLIRFRYEDATEGEADELTLDIDDTANDWYPEQGATLEAWIGFSSEAMMSCGKFTVDNIDYEFAPNVISIRALSDSTKTDLKTKTSTAHEKKTFRQIAQAVADKHKLKLQGTIPDITFDRITQHRKTDLNFLSGLASEYGYAFTVKGDLMVFTSIYELEKGKAVKSSGIPVEAVALPIY